MRRSNWTPSIVPRGNDREVYLVVGDFGKLGRVWREADCETTDRETVLADLFDGQYGSPDRVVCFNSAEGWSRDVTADMAAELRRRCDLQFAEPPAFLRDFLDRYDPIERRQLPLPLRLIRQS